MALFRTPNPWDPRYTLPANVIAEPPGRGTIATVQLPRRTYDNPVEYMTGGYEVPKYIVDEPHGRGAVYSYWDQRKTIPMFLPQQLSGDEGSSHLQAYGDRVADIILGSRPPSDAALEALLRTIDPGLVARVATAMRAGATPRQAISSGVQVGLGQELARLGKRAGYLGGSEAMSGFWSTVKSIGSKVVSIGAAPITSGLSLLGLRKGGITGATSTVLDWGKTVIGKVGDATCKVVGSQFGDAIGGGAAAAAGAPPQIGVVGAEIGKALCAKGQPAAPPPPPPFYEQSWFLPAAAIGGLGLVYLLTRKPTP